MSPVDQLPASLAGSARDALEAALGTVLSPDLASVGADIALWLVGGVLILLAVQVAMLYATWLERKVVARVQDRIGPNRVGPFGLLQPFADMIKMLTKEDVTPRPAYRSVFNLGAILVVPPALLIFAVVPWGPHLIGTDLSVGFLFFIAIASTAVLPIFMAGWGSNNKYALLGAMRAVAQVVAYELPQVLSVVGVLLLAGTLSMQGIVYAQGPISAEGGSYPGVWFIFLQPIAFVIFVLATTAEIERTPFDIPDAESEIIAGYHTEYSGLKFGLFQLALYFATIAAAALGATLFLGGWQPPLAFLSFIPGFFWFAGKTLLFVLFFMWLRATLPRLRVDQLMGFAWKVLVPLALANLFVAGLVGRVTFDLQQRYPPDSLQASPLFVFFGFTLGNLFLVGAFVVLAALWRGTHRRADLGLGATQAEVAS